MIERARKFLLESWVHTPKSLALAWRASPAVAAGIVALTLVSAALPLVIAYLGKVIIDAVIAGDAPLAARWVGAELAVVAVQALVLRSLQLLRSLLGARLGIDVNVMLLEKAGKLELAQFEQAETYDKLTRARREASSRPVLMVQDSLQLLQNALTLAGYIALLVGFSPWAVVGLVVAALPATVAEMRFSSAAFRLRNWRSPDSRRLNYVEYVLANDAHAKEVKVFRLGPLLLDRYRQLSETFFREDRALSTRRAAVGFLLSLVATAAFYGCYAWMATTAARGLMTLGSLTLYLVAFRQGQQSFQSCLGAFGSMYEHNLYMSNLFDFLSLPTVDADRALVPKRSTPTPGDGIRFEGVAFRYPGREAWALRDIDLHIPTGRSLALVGHNGAGKTTFIKLLSRLYDPTEGRITLDGVDLREWDRAELHRRIGIVFQDFNRYQLTFRENVAFGSVEHRSDEPRVRRAIDRGGAGDITATLPEGLDAQLGGWFSRGVELSGGQWQKIALARAFMREEADILVLDEPTAALDAEAEQQVFERFRQLAAGRTTLLISHRFPTVRLADRIVVLEGGRLVEEGTHTELVARGGRYAQLFRLQAEGYLP